MDDFDITDGKIHYFYRMFTSVIPMIGTRILKITIGKAETGFSKLFVNIAIVSST